MSDNNVLEDEIEQSFKTLVALLEFEENAYEQTGKPAFSNDTKAQVIKTAGMLRDELDDPPWTRQINPDEVFCNE